MHFSTTMRVLLPGFLLLAIPIAVSAQDGVTPEVRAAIDRGVKYLKTLPDPNGAWPHENRGKGATSLAAWTLLECGVPANDPVIEKAADVVRQAAVLADQTYDIACAVFFLDKLGDRQDERLIQALGLRLLAGQTQRGDWAYSCVSPAEGEIAALRQMIQNRKPFQPPRVEPGKEAAPKPPIDWRTLPADILQRAAATVDPRNRVGNSGDVSNTQFAMMGRWVCRRHGLPVEHALAGVGLHFRQTQTRSGGWSYMAQLTPEAKQRFEFTPSPAMTCAGLIGLSFDYAVAREKAVKFDINKDAAVRAGLRVVSAHVGDPLGDVNKVPVLKDAGKTYYYLWTLERMAVLYDLKTIGNKDWYAWGAELLLANQLGDGSWTGEFKQGGCDTCFALLFLCRANLAKDLTTKLKNKVLDPGPPPVELLMAIQKEFAPGVASDGKNIPLAANPKKPKVEPAPKPLDAGQLAGDLVTAAGNVQEQLLQKFRDSADPIYTQALLGALPKLKGDARAKARSALTDRVGREPVADLRAFLKAENYEMRRAAALACGQNKARAAVADLITLLEDAETPVQQAAHQALRQVTGQDFGPEADASREERRTAVTAWREWWKKQPDS